MKRRVTRRGHTEDFCEGEHLKLTDLKEKAKDLENEKRYLFSENIPEYPRPEFHVTHLKHDTTGVGLQGIKWINGFCDPDPEGSPMLVWWSLMVTREDMQSAERRLLEQIYPDRTEEQVQKQQSFLEKFATSPAFLDSSRLGSYRFIFPLEELLTAYSQQLCSGAQPVMRVFQTVLYKQEVMYVVLVHSPANDAQFSDYPLLTEDPNAICSYRDGHFIWRPEAMCNTHSYELVHIRNKKQVEAMVTDRKSYVWDNVTVALHMEFGKALQFGSDQLREKLTHCKEGQPPIIRYDKFHKLKEATDLVKTLWPNYPSPLEPSPNIHAS